MTNLSFRMILEAEKKGYTINKNGEVFSVRGQLKLYFIKNKYLCFTVAVGETRNCLPVHRFQAYQKFGNKIFQKGIVVRHLDGNCLNNSWANIEIGSQKENIFDMPEEKRIEKATKASEKIRKFSDKKMEEIRKFHLETESYKKTMEKFGITSKGTLHRILNIEYVTKKE